PSVYANGAWNTTGNASVASVRRYPGPSISADRVQRGRDEPPPGAVFSIRDFVSASLSGSQTNQPQQLGRLLQFVQECSGSASATWRTDFAPQFDTGSRKELLGP